MPERSWLRRIRLAILPVSIGAAVGLAAALLHGSRTTAASTPPQPLGAQVRWAAGAKPAPHFTLRDEHGVRLSLSALRGHPVVLTFLDSVCKRACPLEGRTLADVETRIAPSHAVVGVVGVDPWSETPATVRSFARRMHWSGRWHWFLGSRRQLRPVWKAYGVAVRRIPKDVAHTLVTYLIDARGDLRAGYMFPFRTAALVRDVRTLAARGGV
jgi:cytochrome oxidase Cu insertion factor (SCO1/SenC/PrrC family)